MPQDEELEREVGVVRQGLESDFWAWIRNKMIFAINTDLARLTNKATDDRETQYLRGYIGAQYDLLGLPERFLKSYDEPAEEPLDEQDIPAGRRPSPVLEDEP